MAHDFTSTICALATPPGEGGVALVRLSGTGAYAVAEKVFRPANPEKRVADAKGYTALFGHVLADGAELDEAVVLFYRAPHSYTGEDTVELMCHGGSTLAGLLVDQLIRAGAVPAGPGEFTRRALENGRMSLTQAEAVMDLISAGGRQGAALAKAALDGALAQKIGAIRADLTALAGHLTAWVDYPEENVPALADETLRAALTSARDALGSLIADCRAGAVLRGGVDVALVGRPNVGKSTLLNRLAGFDRAIVTPVAGTTRDVVEQAVNLGGLRLNLFDTAGLHCTEDLVEAEGIRRSYKKLDEAGLVLAVFDGAAPAAPEDLALAAQCRGRAAIAILNKQDLADTERFDEAALRGCFSRVLHLTATSPDCLSQLEQAIGEVLGTARLDPHAASLSGQRQLSAATRARDALNGALDAMALGLDAVSVCLDDALEALCDLTGENAGEAVLEEVFSKFCVGK